MAADLDRLTDDVLRALATGAAAAPPALSFLLARYVASGRTDVRDALEPALAAALDRPFASLAAGDRAAWLRAFVDAVPVAQNDRVLAAVDALVTCLRRDWIQDHLFSNEDRDRLAAWWSEGSGKDLTGFFTTWLLAKKTPPS